MCIAISNYISNKCRHSVAYIELNSTKQISVLNKRNTAGTFTKIGIDFFPSITLSKLTDILSQNYDFFIIDFGILNQFTINEYRRCNTQLAICPVSPWKRNIFDEFINMFKEKYTNYQTQIYFLGNNNKENLNKIHRVYKINILPLPFLPNPFQITSEEFDFFKRIIERNNISQ